MYLFDRYFTWFNHGVEILNQEHPYPLVMATTFHAGLYIGLHTQSHIHNYWLPVVIGVSNSQIYLKLIYCKKSSIKVNQVIQVNLNWARDIQPR